MTARRDLTYTLAIGPNASTIIGPIDSRQTGVFTFTLQYSITAATVTDATLTVRSSNFGRGTTAPPTVAIASLVTPNPQPGFSVVEAAGTITCNASSIGTYEQTWTIANRARNIWLDWQYNSGGGSVTANLVIGGWSY